MSCIHLYTFLLQHSATLVTVLAQEVRIASPRHPNTTSCSVIPLPFPRCAIPPFPSQRQIKLLPLSVSVTEMSDAFPPSFDLDFLNQSSTVQSTLQCTSCLKMSPSSSILFSVRGLFPQRSFRWLYSFSQPSVSHCLLFQSSPNCLLLRSVHRNLLLHASLLLRDLPKQFIFIFFFPYSRRPLFVLFRFVSHIFCSPFYHPSFPLLLLSRRHRREEIPFKQLSIQYS